MNPEIFKRFRLLTKNERMVSSILKTQTKMMNCFRHIYIHFRRMEAKKKQNFQSFFSHTQYSNSRHQQIMDKAGKLSENVSMHFDAKLTDSCYPSDASQFKTKTEHEIISMKIFAIYFLITDRRSNQTLKTNPIKQNIDRQICKKRFIN